MPLQKQSTTINFAQGVDTKTDPNQVEVGKFLAMKNAVFQEGGLLQKRNGFGPLTVVDSSDYLTTFKDNLIALGGSLNTYGQGSEMWFNKGFIQALDVTTKSVVRSDISQAACDIAISPNGYICTVYQDSDGHNSYTIVNQNTNDTIVNPTRLVSATPPKVFLLGNYFVIIYGIGTHIQFQSIPINNPAIISTAVDITTTYTTNSKGNFDAFVSNNRLFIAWNGSAMGGAVQVAYITNTLVVSATVDFTGTDADIMSVTADDTLNIPNIWITYYDSSDDTYTAKVDYNLNIILTPTLLASSLSSVINVATLAWDNKLVVFADRSNNIIELLVTDAGAVTATSQVAQTAGIAAKPFLIDNVPYILSVFPSLYQPTYFLLNVQTTFSTVINRVVAKLAPSNAGPNLTTGLPNSVISNGKVYIPYLFQTLLIPVNKNQGAANTAGVYAQLGVNIATFDFDSKFVSTEIAQNLQLSGGLTWMYDGASPVEQGFNLYPEAVTATPSATGGTMTAQQYFYQVIYQWTDLSGNIHNSAPSIPVEATTTTGASSVTLVIPYLKMTYKSNVNIIVYRWSAAQQVYYQTASVPNEALINAFAVTVVDTQPDEDILGNDIIYTTGGVVENIGPPASSVISLYKSRFFLVDAEDRNLLWFSKQVIEATPIEMSDLFTIYVPPTIGAQGSTGEIRVLSAMDDKLIIFKKDAMYYLVGNGPDNTGANNDFSDPVFISSTVGSSNPKSIVFIPQGLMFQSDKGIWLLGRDLSTQYIGAPVEAFNDAAVLSAINIPGTNQVRFTLDNGITLMYDYYFQKWGWFINIPAISSTIYQGLHTYIDRFGRIFQETPGQYTDNSKPVLMSFTTGWMNLAGLQGFERAYFFYLLGKYLTPHKLDIQIAYDYDPNPKQQVMFIPDNQTSPWGGEALWGSGEVWGGVSNVEQGRIFFEQGKCQAFQLTINEIYDPSFGVPAGAGLTLSGLDIVIGGKKTYPTLKASRSFG